MFITPAFAQTAGGGADTTSFITSLVPMILIFVVFYFLLIRPQQKRAKEHRNMVANLRRGDQVVTSGGIVGKVVKVREGDEIDIEIAEGVRVSVIRSTISSLLSKTEPAKDE